jgi:hypothetical protein
MLVCAAARARFSVHGGRAAGWGAFWRALMQRRVRAAVVPLHSPQRCMHANWPLAPRGMAQRRKRGPLHMPWARDQGHQAPAHACKSNSASPGHALAGRAVCCACTASPRPPSPPPSLTVRQRHTQRRPCPPSAVSPTHAAGWGGAISVIKDFGRPPVSGRAPTMHMHDCPHNWGLKPCRCGIASVSSRGAYRMHGFAPMHVQCA